MKFFPPVLLLLFCFTTSKRQQIKLFYFIIGTSIVHPNTIIMLTELELPILQPLLI